MRNEEKREENILIFDSNSEAEDSTIKFQKNEIDLNANEENNVKKNEIFFFTHNKIEIPEKKDIKKDNKKIIKAQKQSKLNIKFIPNIKNEKAVSNTNESSNALISRFQTNLSENVLYRKDAYYKHFKVILGKYIKNKVNRLKNICFPYYSRNNFSSPNYKFIGNPKEKDNFNFLSFTIKDILLYGKDKSKYNRQYNNEMLIKFIEENSQKTKDKNAYNELINFLNEQLKNIIIQFYDDKIEFDKINKDSGCIKFNEFYQRETGISLLKKYGFLEALNKYNH